MRQLFNGVLLFFILSNRGDGFAQRSNSPDPVSARIDSLINALHTTKYDTNKVFILYELCREYSASKPDKAIKYAKRGLIIAEQSGNRDLIVSGLNNIGLVYRNKYDYDNAIQYHLQTLNISKIFKDTIAAGWCYVEIGNDYYWQSNYADATAYYKKALAVFGKSNFNHGIAVCLNNLGMLCEKRGDYLKAIEYYLKTSDEYEESGNREGIAWCHELIANIYMHQDNYSGAMKYYLLSLSIYDDLNNIKGIALSYNNIGLVLNSQGDYTGALEYFFKALNLFEQLGIEIKIATTSSHIGNAYAKKSEFEPALNYQEKALGISEKIGDKNGLVNSLTGIGNIFNKSGKSPEAVKYLLRSIDIAKESGMKTALKDAYEYLSVAFAQVNDYQNAYDYYQKYAGLKDSLYDEKTSEKISEMQVIYEARNKEKEIELLTKEKELQSIELKKNNIMVYASCCGLAMLIILVIVGIALYRKKQKVNKLLEKRVEKQTLDLSKSNETLQTEIEERKEGENALLKSEQEYRILIEAMKEGVIQVNKDDNIQFVNEQFCKMVGYSVDELLEKNGAELFLNGTDKVFMGEFNSARERGSSRQNIVQLRKKNGGFIRVIISGAANYDELGNITGSTAVVTDITKIMEYEENLDNINQELNAFMYKASHDLMGPLSSSVGIVNMCRESTNDKNILSNLDLISLSLNKLDRILHDLIEITLIRQGKLKLVPVKIKPLLENIVQAFAGYLDFEKTNVIIDNKLRRPLMSDAEILRIILRNLFENALKYRKIGARNSFIKITTGRINKNITIAVADNGIGIPEEHHKNIFKMFVRASTLSTGSGLGLYSVKNAVEKLSGTIELKSKEKEGSTFTLILPELNNHY